MVDLGKGQSSFYCYLVFHGGREKNRERKTGGVDWSWTFSICFVAGERGISSALVSFDIFEKK